MAELQGFNPNAVYQVTTYTDLAAGEIIVHEPILHKESESFETVYIGRTVLHSPQGQAVPLRFPISAFTLEEAVANWLPALKAKLEEMEGNRFRSQLLNGSGHKAGN